MSGIAAPMGTLSTVTLSTVALPTDGPLRLSPRPLAQRNAQYAEQFDAETLFYDVYRRGPDIVFQGPPLLNLAEPVLAAPLLRNPLGPLFRRMRRIERHKASEIRLRSAADAVVLDGPLGPIPITVQPDGSDLFAGRRVLHSLSKDNAPRWIADWIRFYREIHGADAVLLYDNGSTRYSAAGLEADLRAAFPDMLIVVLLWPFKYGPQGGWAGAVDGVEAPWDSDFCQTGSLQHARQRFLQRARSVLNVDIDELVIGPEPIFAATERSRDGFIKFEGQWVSAATPEPVAPEASRHHHFIHRDLAESDGCPPKWCIAPPRCESDGYTWSVHNLFGARANRRIDPRFTFRHFRAINNNWKADRKLDETFAADRFVVDEPLAAAMAQAGLGEAGGLRPRGK